MANGFIYKQLNIDNILSNFSLNTTASLNVNWLIPKRLVFFTDILNLFNRQVQDMSSGAGRDAGG